MRLQFFYTFQFVRNKNIERPNFRQPFYLYLNKAPENFYPFGNNACGEFFGPQGRQSLIFARRKFALPSRASLRTFRIRDGASCPQLSINFSFALFASYRYIGKLAGISVKPKIRPRKSVSPRDILRRVAA